MNGRQMTSPAKLKTLTLLIAVASVCFAQDKTSPIAIDCNFYGNVDFKKLNFRGFSNTKVAPENIIFWRPDSLPRSDKPHYPTYWELGRGFGHITGTVDFREIGPKLRTLASAHGANVVAYQISGKEIRVQFLRVTDDIFRFASSQKDMKPSR
jgi:hypothetical protein